MKSKLLKKLRRKYSIVGKEIHVIKYMYSVKPLHHYKNGEDFNPEWGSYSFKEAKNKQRELILNHIAKLRSRKFNIILINL